MFEMKEKLVKNHYKGIDKKLRISAIISSALLFVAVCTFVPLTASLQSQNVQATEGDTQEPVNDNNLDASYIEIPEDK